MVNAEPMSELDLPTYQDVVDASCILRNVAHRTPILTSRSLNDELGVRVFFKCENFQRIGAFKFRGAYTAIRHYQNEYSSENQGANLPGVLTYSSGNHAQAIALAASSIGSIPSTIIMPTDAPPLKLQATESYGGTVVFYDRYKEKRDDVARRVKETLPPGTVFIPPYNHKYVIAGQGTVAKELYEDLQCWSGNHADEISPNNQQSKSSTATPTPIKLDYLFVCVGGGGLISGCALATQSLSPHTKIIGVEPRAGNDAQRSLETGQIVSIPTPRTIADGAQTQHLGDLTFAIMQTGIQQIVTVSDEDLVREMKFYGERMKIIVEPTGCLGLAGLRKMVNEGMIEKGSCCGVVISGGNVDMERYCKLMNSLSS